MKKRLMIFSAAVLAAVLCLAAVFASGENTLVTLRYLTGTFKEQLTAALTEPLDDLNKVYQSALDKAGVQAGSGSAAWVVTDAPRTLYPQPGETVTLSAGSSLVWYAGKGSVAGVLIDATMGVELAPGGSLVPGHRYLAEEPASVTAATAASCGAEGMWLTTATGTGPPAGPVILSEGIDPLDRGTAQANTQTVLLDGTPREFQTYALTDARGGVTNYIKLRDLAYLLSGTPARFSVDYVRSAGVITVFMDRGQPYEPTGSELTTPFQGSRPYRKAASSAVVNGSPVQLQAFILTDDQGGDYTYYKLRDLGQALNFFMDWSLETGVVVDSSRPYSSGR